MGGKKGEPATEKREGALGGAGAAGVSDAWGRDAGSLGECVVALVLVRKKSRKEQTTGLVLNWAQVVVGLSRFGPSGERVMGVQSAARGVTVVVVRMASWTVPPGERIPCS